MINNRSIFDIISEDFDELSKMTDEELKKISNGECNISINLKYKGKNKQIQPTIDKSIIDGIIKEISELTNVKTVESIIKSKLKKKNDIEKLAKALEISYSSKESISNIVDKILDATIVAKLNSAAIRGQ
ncbi:hypothetical protein [Morganella psychrotolerans]|uniref:Uncharacterized protein n=1 Tax=Morganella psychrotolerans TaxID=368603 RepID=A0A1B8HUY4_9GAMM|nr:hypothetical protein [Morganella psychrotolerans]OBU13569.1 hypothetical protein AYY18_02245 [Morganella psychrotolerans]